MTTPQIIDVARFVGHVRVLNNGEKQGFFIHTPSRASLYPAVSVLSHQGQRSADVVMNILATPIDPETLRSAEAVLFTIYSRNPESGIQAIREFASKHPRLRSAELNHVRDRLIRACEADTPGACTRK